MVYVVTQVTHLFERLRKLLGYRELSAPKDYPLMPILQVNDPTYYSSDIIVRTLSSTGTVFAVPNDPQKQFYIDGIQMSGYLKTVADAINSCSATIDGASRILYTQYFSYLDGLSLAATPALHEGAIAFNVPIRVDRNTNITFAMNSTAGNVVVYGHFESIK